LGSLLQVILIFHIDIKSLNAKLRKKWGYKFMHFMKKSIFLILTSVLIFGCASIVSQSEYDVSITSKPTNSFITITDRDGMDIYTGSTPAHVRLPADAGYFAGARYTVKFEKTGFQTQTLFLQNKIDGWYFGNILIGGVIGLLIIDPLTGAMWKLPSYMHAQLSSGMNSLNIDESNIDFVLYEDIPEEMKDKLIPVE